MVGRVLWLVLAVALCGCRGMRFGPYTSPAVSGRVVAADSQLPLAGVEVVRDGARRGRGIGGQPKGAELLLQDYTARTGGDGRFHLQSQRALTVFRPSGWDHVGLSFRRAGYLPFQTNYSILIATTNSPAGDPLLETGDIALRPVRR